MGRRINDWGVPNLQDMGNIILPGPLRNRNIVTQLPQRWQKFWKALGKDEEKRKGKVARMLDLMNSSPGLADEDRWIPNLVVGAGGFGVAAVFQKRDSIGAIEDVSHFSKLGGNY